MNDKITMIASEDIPKGEVWLGSPEHCFTPEGHWLHKAGACQYCARAINVGTEETVECPYCHGGCSIVCCMLCGGSNIVPKVMAEEYRNSDETFATRLRLKEKYRGG